MVPAPPDYQHQTEKHTTQMGKMRYAVHTVGNSEQQFNYSIPGNKEFCLYRERERKNEHPLIGE
jgi:hypothetical protein